MRKKIGSFLNTKHLYYTPIAILIFVNFIKIVYFKFYPALNFDETVVINISTQPWEIFLKSVSSEPHPIFFYLFLRLFRTLDFTTTKIIFSLISTSILITTVFLVNRHKVWEKHGFTHGVYLLFVSLLFFSTTSQIKQDALTVPLLFLFLNIYFIYKQNRDKKYLNFMFVVTLMLLLFGFRPFVSAMTVWIYELVLIIKKDKRWGKELKNVVFKISAILSSLAIYFILFGLKQLVNNRYRMSWAKSFSNSLSGVLIENFFPFKMPLLNPNELSLALLFIVVFYAFKDIRKGKIINEVEISVLYLIVFNFIVGYFVSAYIQLRYSAFLLILLYFLISKYLIRLNYRIYIFIFFFYLTGTVLVSGINFKNSYEEEISRHFDLSTISKNKDNEPFLWLMDWTASSPVYLSKYKDLENIVTVSMDRSDNVSRYITYESLQLSNNESKEYWDRKGKNDLFTDIDSLIKDGHSNVIYSMGNNRVVRKDLLDFLNSKCKIDDIRVNSFGETVVLYKNCY